MNDRNEALQKEMERLAIRREKDLHNGLVERLRRESAEENWDLAESVFTPEELAEWFARDRRLGLTLKLDFATFWLSILFLNGVHTTDPLAVEPEGLVAILIGLILITFFWFFVLFFQLRSHRQDHTREFALRIEARKKAGEKNTGPERDAIGFRGIPCAQKEDMP